MSETPAAGQGMKEEQNNAILGGSSSSGAGLAAAMDAAGQPVPSTPVRNPAAEEQNDMQDVSRARPTAEPGGVTPDKPATTKVRVEEVCANMKVQDLQNVDESFGG